MSELNDGTPAQIEQRLAAARSEAADLRRQLGAALVDGSTDFDRQSMRALDDEIVGLEAALLIAQEREIASENTRRARVLSELASQLADLENERQRSLGAAECAARELVLNLNAAIDISERMRGIIRTMDVPVPLPLAEGAFVDRLSQRLAAVLALLRRSPARFGQLGWRPSWRSPDDDWSAAEAAELAPDLQPLIDAA